MEFKEKQQIKRLISAQVEKAVIINTLNTEFIPVRQAAKLYGVSLRQMYYLRDQKRVTFHYLSKRKPFVSRTEVELMMRPQGIGYAGVFTVKLKKYGNSKRYYARIQNESVVWQSKFFKTEKEAAIAYDKKCLSLGWPAKNVLKPVKQ